MLICVTVLKLKHDLFNYFHIGNVNTQDNVDQPGPQLVVEPPPQGCSPSVLFKKFRKYYMHYIKHVRPECNS